MPTITGPIIPNSTTFWAVSDAYVGGGYRCVATYAELLTIPASYRKRGMVGFAADTSKEYLLESDLVTWTETEDRVNANFHGRARANANPYAFEEVKSCYLTAATGAGGYGSTSDTCAISLGNRSRIARTMPYASAVRFAFGTGIANVTHLSFQVWRRRNEHWYLVGTTENLKDRVTESAINTLDLANPIARPQAGDWAGWKMSVGSATTPLTPTLGTGSLLTVTKATDTLANDMWLAGTSNNVNYAVPVEFLGPPADGVAIGDSLTAGSPGTRSAWEAAIDQTGSGGLNYFDAFYPERQCSYWIGKAIGKSIQNVGISSQKSSDIVARFAADVTAMKPQFAIICMGTNNIPDYGAGGDYSPLMDDWDTVIDACLTARIWPICAAIPPRSDWCTPSTYWASQMRRAANAALATKIATTYAGRAKYVNVDSTLGKNYASGDSGNLDAMQDAYNADSVHYNVAGYTAEGDYIGAQMLAEM